MAAGEDRPFHETIVDDDKVPWVGQLFGPQVGPMTTLELVMKKAGKDDDGNWRLPSFKRLLDTLPKYTASVDGKRAQMMVDALAYDNWEPRPSSDEWDPDRRGGPPRSADEGDPDPGLPRRED